MIKHRKIGIVAGLLMLAAIVFVGIGFFAPSAYASVFGSADMPYVAIMDKNTVLDIQIVADKKEWAAMLENATAEQYISATVIINGKKIKNVGIRPKGNSSLSQVASDSTTDRYSFKIEFDQYVPGQTWMGLDKLVVNNMQGDATYMKEYLSYDIMSYVGVETPLYAFSNISVNGEKWGFYLAVEALEDSYAKRVYGTNHGKLYKPESMGGRGNGQMNEFIENMQGENTAERVPQGFENQNAMPNFGQNQALIPQEGQAGRPVREQGAGGFGGEAPQNTFGGRGNMGGGGMGGFGGSSGGATLQYTDDEFSSYSTIFDGAVFDISDTDRRSLISALKSLNAGEDLESAVDVEATLKYFAAHAVIVNLDSYISGMCHNYYLYENNGQLTMLPWDFNLAFGGFQSGSASSIVNFPIDTPVSGVSLEDRPILAKLLEVPEYMELYHSYLQKIVDGYFTAGKFEKTVDNLDALISSHVENDPSAFYSFSAYTSGVAELKTLGNLRAKSIAGQLNGSIPSTTDRQSANPAALVDASAINLTALGSMGGMGFGGRLDGENIIVGNIQAFDVTAMQRAMEIIQEADGAALTPEQLAELEALGIAEEQISLFQSMQAGALGGGNMGGAFGGRPANLDGNNAPQGGISGGGNPSASAGYDAAAWLTLGGGAALMIAGIMFVLFFKRRRAAM